MKTKRRMIPLACLIFSLFVTDHLAAQSDDALFTAPMPKDYVKTNGQYVVIGNIMVETNSALVTDEFKQFKWRDELLMRIERSDASNRLDLVVEGAWKLARDYPDRINGYQCIMMVTEDYDYEGQTDKARTLAAQLLASSAPDTIKAWTKGFLNRLDSRGRPVELQFTALDGRDVNLSSMRGKVVLVDFWATTCGPCVAELPRVKATYDRFHSQGFEVIGIDSDREKDQLERYLKKHALPWPQFFDGKASENKWSTAFGIDGIPHMFLVDKQGVLRFDNVRASDKYHAPNDTSPLEDKITKLLAEQ